MSSPRPAYHRARGSIPFCAGCLPADSGYLSAALVVSALAAWGIALIGPLLADKSAQACADFAVDYDS
jgi:hypothetical protein